MIKLLLKYPPEFDSLLFWATLYFQAAAKTISLLDTYFVTYWFLFFVCFYSVCWHHTFWWLKMCRPTLLNTSQTFDILQAANFSTHTKSAFTEDMQYRESLCYMLCNLYYSSKNFNWRLWSKVLVAVFTTVIGN